MINIILISHGNFCIELLKSIKMVTGTDFNIQAVPLLPGETLESYRNKLEITIRKQINSKGILILSDIMGGTPYNTAVYLSKNYSIGLISGMNMPMILDIGFNRTNDDSLDKLIQQILKNSQETITGKNLNKKRRIQHEKLSINKN